MHLSKKHDIVYLLILIDTKYCVMDKIKGKPMDENNKRQEPVWANTDTSNYVIIANELIMGKSTLTLNATKLLRLVIMQCQYADYEFRPYKISMKTFAELLNISVKNLYTYAHNICVELLQEVVEIGDKEFKGKWHGFQWVSECTYKDGVITIKLHENLEKYLLGLRKNYTQYELCTVLLMKSVPTIRLFELMKMKMVNRTENPFATVSAYLSVDEIRMVTNKESYRVSDLISQIINPALQEINELYPTTEITVKKVKNGRATVGFEFTRVSKRETTSPEINQRIERIQKKAEQTKMLKNLYDYE